MFLKTTKSHKSLKPKKIGLLVLGFSKKESERIAEAIIYALEQDPGVSANEIVIRPIAQET